GASSVPSTRTPRAATTVGAAPVPPLLPGSKVTSTSTELPTGGRSASRTTICIARIPGGMAPLSPVRRRAARLPSSTNAPRTTGTVTTRPRVAAGDIASPGSCDRCTDRTRMSPSLIVVPTGRSRTAAATSRGGPRPRARRCRAARSVATMTAVTTATTTGPAHKSTTRGERRRMMTPPLERRRDPAPAEWGRGGGGGEAPCGGRSLGGGGAVFRGLALRALGVLRRLGIRALRARRLLGALRVAAGAVARRAGAVLGRLLLLGLFALTRAL